MDAYVQAEALGWRDAPFVNMSVGGNAINRSLGGSLLFVLLDELGSPSSVSFMIHKCKEFRFPSSVIPREVGGVPNFERCTQKRTISVRVASNFYL